MPLTLFIVSRNNNYGSWVRHIHGALVAANNEEGARKIASQHAYSDCCFLKDHERPQIEDELLNAAKSTCRTVGIADEKIVEPAVILVDHDGGD